MKPFLLQVQTYVLRGLFLLWQGLVFVTDLVVRAAQRGYALLQRVPLSPIQWVLVLFFVMALAYAWATPVFEASDELWHFGFVNYVADTGELPVQQPDVKTPWAQEGSQPPLYYLIAGAIAAPFDRSDLNTLREPNPHAIAGNAAIVGNKNLVLHDTPYPVFSGAELAVYAVRLFSIALGLATVYVVYRCGRLLMPDRPIVGLLAAGLTAFNPMFLFITASVNNDNLVILLNSIAIYLMLRLLRGGFSFRLSLGLALVIALGSLTKLSALVLIPVVVLAAAWTAYRRKDRRGLLIFGALLVGIWAVVAGWWYLRNVNLYGELFGTITMAEVAGTRTAAFSVGSLLSEFQGFRIAYWGLFGAVNIQMSDIFYLVMDVMVAGALLSLVFLLLQQWTIREYESERKLMVEIVLLGLIIVIGAFSIILWTSQTYASQGRLLFPFVAAISTLLAVGVAELLWWLLYALRPLDYSVTVPDVKRLEQMTAIPVKWGVTAFAAVALIVPFAIIAPQYAPPPTVDALPADAQPVYARFGDVALIGYQAPDARYFPGDSVPITLYWQVLEQSSDDLSLYLTAYDDHNHDIGKVDTYPGAGRLRTTEWEPGKIYADSYSVPLRREVYGRFPLRLQVGWWNYPGDEMIPAEDADGAPISSVMLNVGALIDPYSGPVLDQYTQIDPQVLFGDTIALSGIQHNGDTFNLLWRTIGVPGGDYRVFAHVLSGDVAALFPPPENATETAAPPTLTPTPTSPPLDVTVEVTAETTAEATPSGSKAFDLPLFNPTRYFATLADGVDHVIPDLSSFTMVGQGDAAPELPTHYWRPGEYYVTQNTLVFDQTPAPGDYLVAVGWYSPDDLTRLPLGDAYPDSAYPLVLLHVKAADGTGADSSQP